MSYKESEIENMLGKEVVVKGRTSEVIWQHMIAYYPDFPEANYVDFINEDGSEGYQYVVYSKKPLPSDCLLELTGEFIKTGGESKRPDKERRKYYYEYQFIAKEYRQVNEV